MKSIFLKSISLVLLTIGLWSCKKDETKTVSDVSPAGTLTASATSLNLVQANATKPALTLTFPAPTVTGYQIPVTSTLQFALAGTGFKVTKEIVATTTTYSPTVNDFNTMLLALGLKIGVSGQVDVRLKSAPAPNAVTYSNVITITATPYLASAWVYAPGAYQGWNPATADSLVSLTSNGIYQGIINYPVGQFEFKITPAKTWDVSYGDGGGGTLSTSGGNLNAGVAGLRLVTVNMNTKTWTIANADSWSIIGSATPKGWDADTDMKFINDGKGGYKITIDLVAGEFKFRQNHAWTVNFGGSIGALVLNAGNIAVAAAGNYTITFIPVYTQPVPTDPPVLTGATATLVKN
nr:SusE domain-containing protein [Pedobacter sp. ASV19]